MHDDGFFIESSELGIHLAFGAFCRVCQAQRRRTMFGKNEGTPALRLTYPTWRPTHRPSGKRRLFNSSQGPEKINKDCALRLRQSVFRWVRKSRKHILDGARSAVVKEAVTLADTAERRWVEQ